MVDTKDGQKRICDIKKGDIIKSVLYNDYVYTKGKRCNNVW